MSKQQAAIKERRALVMQCLQEIPSATIDEIRDFLGQRGIDASHGTVVRDRQAVLAEYARGNDSNILGIFDESVYILMDLARKAHRENKAQSAALCIRELKSLLKMDDVIVSGIDELTERVNLIDEHYKTLIGKEG